MPVAALGRMPKSTPGRPIRLCGRNLGRSSPPGEMCSAAYQARDGSPARLFRRVRKTGIIRAAISEIKNENENRRQQWGCKERNDRFRMKLFFLFFCAES